MTKTILKALYISILILVYFNLNAQDNKVKYNVNGKLVTYYALSQTDSLNISLSGPGKLTVTTRARFTNNSPDSLSYSILYQIDNVIIKVFTAKKVLREDSSVYIQSADDRPSTVKSFTIKIDPEVHNISFVMLNESPQVDLHYKFIPDSVPEWSDVKSLNDTTVITLMVDKGKDKSYYRLSSSSPQKFKVKGPTSLRVITRLEYDYAMQGLISYRIMVKRNDTVINTYKLEGNPSTLAQYADDNKHIPGTLEKFYLDVPPGENIYEFTLVNKHFTSLIRVSRQKIIKTK